MGNKVTQTILPARSKNKYEILKFIHKTLILLNRTTFLLLKIT